MMALNGEHMAQMHAEAIPGMGTETLTAFAKAQLQTIQKTRAELDYLPFAHANHGKATRRAELQRRLEYQQRTYGLICDELIAHGEIEPLQRWYEDEYGLS